MARSPGRRTQAEVAQAVGGHERVGGVGVRQDDRELVAADAEGTVAVAQRVADAVGHAHEQAVAGRMALAVVDDLEVVEVDEQQRDGHLVATVELELAVELLLERAVVAEAGEAVVQRVLARLAVEHLELGLRPGEVVEGLQEGPGDDDGDEQHDDGEGRRARRAAESGPAASTGQTWMSPKRAAVAGRQSGAAVATQPAEVERTCRARVAADDAVDVDAQVAEGPRARGAGAGFRRPLDARDSASTVDGARGRRGGAAVGLDEAGRALEEPLQVDVRGEHARVASRAGLEQRRREGQETLRPSAQRVLAHDAAGPGLEGRRHRPARAQAPACASPQRRCPVGHGPASARAQRDAEVVDAAREAASYDEPRRPGQRRRAARQRDLTLLGAADAVRSCGRSGSAATAEQARLEARPGAPSGRPRRWPSAQSRSPVAVPSGREDVGEQDDAEHGQDGQAEHGHPEPGPDEAERRSGVRSEGGAGWLSVGDACASRRLVRPFNDLGHRPGMARNAHGRTGPLGGRSAGRRPGPHAREARLGCAVAQAGSGATTMRRSSVMSSMAQRTPSRPRPLSLTPP